MLAFAFDACVAPGTLLPTVAAWLAVVNLVLGVFNLLPGAPLDGGRVLAALLWKRNGDRRGAQISAAQAGTRASAAMLVAGSLALVFAGYDFFITALVGFFVLERVAPGREHARACCARSTTAPSASSCGRSRSSAPDWTTVADFGPDRRTDAAPRVGRHARLRSSLPARSSPSHPRQREHVQLRALGVPLAQLPRVPTDAPRDRRGGGRPARDRRRRRRQPVGLFGLDELKIAARRDPVLARSRR